MQIIGKHKVKLILVSGLKALAIAFFILFNPLGLKNTSQEQSEMLYLDTTASTFDANLESAVVVLIDEYTLEKYHLNYPVDYRSLSRILRSISSHNPNSVFIDILQNYQHSKELDYWLKHLKKSSERHPIYLAQDLEFDKEWRLNDKENIRYKLSQNTTLVPVSWRGPSNRYPLMISLDGQNHKTTALLMYERYCESANCQLFQSSENYDESMVVRWNNKNSNEQMAFLNVADGCEFQQRSMYQAFRRHVTYGFQNKKEMDEHRVKCPPILTLSADDFLAPNATGNQDLRKVIENRAVFIGYDLLGSSDLVVSPVHNQLPGVFYHAMAFVNLVSMDTKYWRSPNVIGECPIVGDCNFSYYDLIQILLYAVVIGFSLYLKKSYVLYSDDEMKKLLTSSGLFLVVIISVVFSIIVFQYTAGPANWIALISILIISASMLIKPVIIYIYQWVLINSRRKASILVNEFLILRDKLMVKKMRLFYLMIFLFFSYPTYAVDNTVIQFNSGEVEVCTSATDMDTCDYVKVSRLPDPKKVTIKVLDFTEEGMVKLNINGQIKYIHQMDLKLSARATVSEPCVDKEFNSRADKNTYATHGMMDKCDAK